MSENEEKYVLDTSVVIEKITSKLIKEKKLKGKIIIPRAVLAELEHQANTGQETGMLGLEELQELQEFKKQEKIELEFLGDRPKPFQIKYAKSSGEIDSIIRDLAFNEDAILITADTVLSEAAKAYGVKVKFISVGKIKIKLEFEKFFDNTTMSIHIKENCFVVGKKGTPGNWLLTKINDKKLATEEVQDLAKEIVEYSRIDPGSFIEISRRGSTIVQYKDYRVVITKPPVSDGWEITVVKPLVKLDLKDYNLDEDLFNRLKEKARGVIVAGQVGSGKSTFAQAIAESYLKYGKIVKTVESPRDLQLPDEITQYSKNFTTSEEIHDILFLTRPDNIIYDEMRDTPDFKLYTDLRLAGSNGIGVLHAATPIDAVQRFIGRLETGMIPSIVDTILFIENGKIEKVLTLKILIKVPSGMTEADLARPVVEVRDFKTDKLEFEIYSYGEETVVLPINERQISSKDKLALRLLNNEIKKYSRNAKVEFLGENKVAVYVPEDEIARIIGREGKTISAIEKELGISIEVRELKELKQDKIINVDVYEKRDFVVFKVGNNYTKHNISFYLDGKFLFSAIAGKQAEIKINKNSDLGVTLVDALRMNKNIILKV